ncbi:hypothetical protein QE152_g11238 [Popillia japonica]|uniref:Kazal-like domain-containing protein n=1 Tax=Popillia japonica TaxID=7064 RepID=A0AAW1LSH2_POPJA
MYVCIIHILAKLNIMKGVIAVSILAIVLCTNIVHAIDCRDTVCFLDAFPFCTVDVSGNVHLYIGSCSLAIAKCEHPEKQIKVTALQRCPKPKDIFIEIIV